ncbi:MAG: aminotransferase class V-fold PLP-dependent enzyme, partial [Acidimicrobiales bacterium]
MAELNDTAPDVDGTPVPADRTGLLDVATLRKDFPLLSVEVHGRPITFLDSAASSQRPVQVLDAMREYDETTHANVHRGVYSIAEEATRRFEAARHNVGRFIGAPDPSREVIFTKNATEGLNLVAHTWGRTHLRAGDAIVLTEIEPLGGVLGEDHLTGRIGRADEPA